MKKRKHKADLRKNILRVPATDEEKEKIAAKAAGQGLSLASYMRAVALGGRTL